MEKTLEDDSSIVVGTAALRDLTESLSKAQAEIATAHRHCANSVSGRRAVYVLRTELETTIGRIGQLLKDREIRAVTEASTAVESSMRTACTAADKLFSIPELVELIYEHLDIVDLPTATRVTRTTAELCRSSKRIRRIMCLKPDEIPRVHLPLLTLGMTNLTLQPDRASNYAPGSPAAFATLKCNEAMVIVSFNPSERLPTLGPRTRAMLICQPPAKEATLVMRCCDYQGHWSAQRRGSKSCLPFEVVRKMTSSTGITFGDLLDATERFRTERAYCPVAQLRHIDDDGHARVRVEMKAVVPRTSFDTLNAEAHGMWKIRMEYEQRRAAAYSRAKTEGKGPGGRSVTPDVFIYGFWITKLTRRSAPSRTAYPDILRLRGSFRNLTGRLAPAHFRLLPPTHSE